MSFNFRSVIFLLLQYVFCFAAISKTALSELDIKVYFLMGLWGLVIILIQSIFVCFIKNINIKLLLGAFFSAINFLLFYQSYDYSFVNLSLTAQLLFFGLNIAIFAILFYLIWRSKIYMIGISFICVLAISYVSVLNGISENFNPNKGNSTNIRFFDQTISSLNFEKKPDVHILIYDSMISKRPSLNAFGKVPDYYETFIKQKMIVYENSFVERVPTRPSLKKFFALGDGKYPYTIIVGKSDSPLAKIFRQNGYYIQVGTRQGYSLTTNSMKFDKNRTQSNNYFDEYFYDDNEIFSSSPVCVSEVSSGIFLYFKQHFWFCHLASNFLQEEKNNLHGWPQKILDKMSSLSNKKPMLTLSYIYYPIGHTHSDYDYKNKLDRDKYYAYFTKASKYLSQHFSNLKEIFVKRGKPYVLLVFGDHGTFAKRGVYKDNNIIEVIDHYNVFTGLELSSLICNNIQKNRSDLDTPTSPSQLMIKIINCLSGNNNKKLVYPIENHELEIYEKYGLKIENVIK